MREYSGKNVILKDHELLRRQAANKEYLLSLKNEHLLRNFEFEAGRFTNREIDTQTMGGWEAPNCQLRGHFLGHWLSAAAYYYEQTGDTEVNGKAAAIIHELTLCQKDNGGTWVGPIPEKYLYWIAEGRSIWAPQYTLHKLFMGLVDQYLHAGNQEALEIAERFADWFYDWSGKYTREEFDNILDFETGGMLEIWAQLFEITGKNKYQTLMERYRRGRLFDSLVEGKDVLTNMHANTTIPEILGCARCYEATGDEKWLDIVKAYWKCAVTDRGSFATGGQTQGEIWTPKMKLKARLGARNQEHCTVYNMCRLADFLFLETGDPAYLQYKEYNLYNGIMAQTYFQNVSTEDLKVSSGLLTYFLPMMPGAKKDWAGRMDAFFCCHGTMVQANARLNEGLFYEDKDGKGRQTIYVAQYFEADLQAAAGQTDFRLELREDHLNGLLQSSSENNVQQRVGDTAAAYAEKPDFRKYVLRVHTEGEALDADIAVRIPDWIRGTARVFRGEQLIEAREDAGFVKISGPFSDGDVITVLLPIGISFVTLPDDPSMGAFRYGAEVLSAMTGEERILHLDADTLAHPEKELEIEDEREWGTWLNHFKTRDQDPGLHFKPIREIGTEAYQMYFKVTGK